VLLVFDKIASVWNVIGQQTGERRTPHGHASFLYCVVCPSLHR
jgi:hypothetical protein